MIDARALKPVAWECPFCDGTIRQHGNQFFSCAEGVLFPSGRFEHRVHSSGFQSPGLCCARWSVEVRDGIAQPGELIDSGNLRAHLTELLDEPTIVERDLSRNMVVVGNRKEADPK